MSATEVINLVIGILGLMASLVGFYFTYITFVNPLVRFKQYLRRPTDWERFIGIEIGIDRYRHRKYPSFEIVIDWNNECVDNFHEEWINDGMFPDKTNNASYYVQLLSNGMLLSKELFVSLDGHRYFVPVPRTQGEVEGRRFYYYDQIQIQLSRIVGRFYFDQDIQVFAQSQHRLALNEYL